MLSKVAIVGRPNVGKSTLFNRIVGERLSITDDEPGVTRDRIYAKASWLSREFAVIDTGGIEISDAPFLTEIRAQAEVAMDEADVIIMVVDCRNGITEDDTFVAKLLQRTNKPVLLCVNKVDDQKFKDYIYEFYGLGLGDPVAVSSIHGVGVGDLLDAVIRVIPQKADKLYDDSICFSLIGRPNVGKSSLTNALLNDERTIVSPIAGTTRDAIDTPFKAYDRNYVVIDTAGLRKSGKIYENAEKYSVIRTVSAIQRSEVVLLLLDAETGFQAMDKIVGGYVKEYNRPCIIVVNKWDTVKKENKTQDEWTKKVRENFQYLEFAPIVFVSAKEHKGLQNIFPQITKAYDSYVKRVKTGVLNDVFADALAMNPPFDFNNGHPKFFYISQVGVEPPTFALFVNEPKFVHFSYMRYIENQIRKTFDFYGTPIKLQLRRRD